MEKENFFYRLYARIRDYFTKSLVRKVFFFALCSLAGSALLSLVTGVSELMFVAVFSAMICFGSSAVDSFTARKEFLETVYQTEYEYFLRKVEEVGEEEALEADGPIGENEMRFVKRKKREFGYSIIIKVVFIIFLVVLLVGMV
jgi:hypothetical protein